MLTEIIKYDYSFDYGGGLFRDVVKIPGIAGRTHISKFIKPILVCKRERKAFKLFIIRKTTTVNFLLDLTTSTVVKDPRVKIDTKTLKAEIHI